MSDVTINYKGNAIATMDASGTKTLLTEGTYCEDDIEVAYERPSSFDKFQEVEYLTIGNSRTYIRLPYTPQIGDVLDYQVSAVDWSAASAGMTSIGIKTVFAGGDSNRINASVRASNGQRYKSIYGAGTGSVYVYGDSSIIAANGVAAYYGDPVNNGDIVHYKLVINGDMTNRYLFYGAYNNNEYIKNGNLYRFTITDSKNQKKIDLIPCYRLYDNVTGFYEAVSGSFITQSEGSFTAGPDVPSAQQALAILLGGDTQ